MDIVASFTYLGTYTYLSNAWQKSMGCISQYIILTGLVSLPYCFWSQSFYFESTVSTGIWKRISKTLLGFIQGENSEDVSSTSFNPSFPHDFPPSPNVDCMSRGKTKQNKPPFLHTIHFKLQNPPKSPISLCSLVPTLQLSSSPSERKKLFFKGLIGCRAMLSNNIPVP